MHPVKRLTTWPFCANVSQCLRTCRPRCKEATAEKSLAPEALMNWIMPLGCWEWGAERMASPKLRAIWYPYYACSNGVHFASAPFVLREWRLFAEKGAGGFFVCCCNVFLLPALACARVYSHEFFLAAPDRLNRLLPFSNPMSRDMFRWKMFLERRASASRFRAAPYRFGLG